MHIAYRYPSPSGPPPSTQRGYALRSFSFWNCADKISIASNSHHLPLASILQDTIIPLDTRIILSTSAPSNSLFDADWFYDTSASHPHVGAGFSGQQRQQQERSYGGYPGQQYQQQYNSPSNPPPGYRGSGGHHYASRAWSQNFVCPVHALTGNSYGATSTAPCWLSELWSSASGG